MPRQRLLFACLLLGLGLLAPGRPAYADDTADCKGINTLDVGAREFSAGDNMTITWEACAVNGSDWIGLYVPASSDASPLAYRSISTATGTSTFPLPSGLDTGPYELRLFSGKTTLRLAQSPSFYVHGTTVTPAGTLSHVWSSLSRGSSQTFNWTVAPAHANDQVNIYLYGGALAQTCWTHGQAAGQMLCYLDSGLVSAGTYVACLYAGEAATTLVCDSTFTVT